MKVSVVTVAYNEQENVERTLKSVLDQTYANIEYVVIDGGSTDGTAEIIARYGDRLAYWVSERDGGIYFGMNKGLAKCTGDYLLFCNAGDALASSDVIERMARAADDAGDADLVFGDCMDVLGGKGFMRKARGPDFIRFGMPASHEAMMYRLALVRELGLCYDTSYRIAADYKFTYQFVRAAREFRRVDLPIVVFSEGGVSTANKWSGLSETCRVRKEVSGMNCLQRMGVRLAQSAVLLAAEYASPIYRAIRLSRTRI